jgi:hypothetical protein
MLPSIWARVGGNAVSSAVAVAIGEKHYCARAADWGA